MAGTVVLAVRRKLVDLFGTVGGLDATVTYAWPGLELLGDRAIYFLPAKVTSEPGGHRAVKYRRDETVDQPFIISVNGRGMSQEDADAECVSMMALIEELIAENDGLPGAAGPNQQVLSIVLSSWDQLANPHESGHDAGIEVHLAYMARSL